MKNIFFFLFVLLHSCIAFAQDTKTYLNSKSINTAAAETYLNEEEKLLFAYINLARTQPQFYADSILKPYAATKDAGFAQSQYVTSLYNTLKSMKPLPALVPDKQLYDDAACFATASGITGATGHSRKGTNCKMPGAENCSYGLNRAYLITLQMLIDKDIPSLGHRLNCLGNYKSMGVSIKPHKTYRNNAVLHFK